VTRAAPAATALASAVAALAGLAAAASLPLKMNVQGKLLDPATGAPRNGTYSITFKLYDVPAGGTAEYAETQSVTVTNGVFAAQLGKNALLSPDLFTGASAYLGLTIPPDSEMTPRQQLVMSPYAYTAAQLVQANDITVNAGTAYSTFTAAGDLELASSLLADDAALSAGLTASSGTFTATGPSQYSLQTSSGIDVQAGTLLLEPSSAGLDASGTGIAAATATLTAAGPSQYSLLTSSGIDVRSGTLAVDGAGGIVAASTVAAADYFGSGADLTSPRPSVSSATLSNTVTVTANAETVVLSTDITPSRADSLIQVWVTLGLNRAANSLSTWQLRVRRQIGGTCTTSSPQVGITNNATVTNNANFSMLVPILKVDSPGTTSQVEYCLTVTCPQAQSLDERTMVLMDVSP
jgi:hypothetical protein